MIFFQTSEYDNFKNEYISSYKLYLDETVFHKPWIPTALQNFNEFITRFECYLNRKALEVPGSYTYGIIGQYLNSISQDSRDKNGGGFYTFERNWMINYVRLVISKFVPEISFSKLVIDYANGISGWGFWRFFINKSEEEEYENIKAIKKFI